VHAKYRNDDFQFGLEIALGAAYRRCADVGEVLATVDRISDGDAAAWLREWTATADAARAAGEAAASRGRASARSHFQRAATYYATAIDMTPEPQRAREIWRRQRECWDRAVDLFPAPGERVAIPSEGTTLPAYVFRAPDAAPGERRPLVVMNNGSDGATSQMWPPGRRRRGRARVPLAFRGEPYGVEGDSPYDLYQAVLAHRLGHEVARITTPILTTDPEDEQFWPGQSRELYERLPGPKEIVAFSAAEGANRHCEPLGSALREARIFDWLDGHLA
jgi:hypothetical protein